MERIIRFLCGRYRLWFNRYKFVRYATCGAFSSFVHHGTLLFLSAGLGVKFWVSAATGYVLSLILDFFLQKKITFSNRDYNYLNLGRQGLLFYAIRLINLGNYLVLAALLGLKNHTRLTAILLSAAIILVLGVISFLFDNYITFSRYEKFNRANIRNIISGSRKNKKGEQK